MIRLPNALVMVPLRLLFAKFLSIPRGGPKSCALPACHPSPKGGAHRNCKLLKPPTVLGIVPLSWLSSRYLPTLPHAPGREQD